MNKCPNCNNKSSRDIYMCNNCGKYTCYNDGIVGFGSSGCRSEFTFCQYCNSKLTVKKVGSIL